MWGWLAGEGGVGGMKCEAICLEKGSGQWKRYDGCNLHLKVILVLVAPHPPPPAPSLLFASPLLFSLNSFFYKRAALLLLLLLLSSFFSVCPRAYSAGLSVLTLCHVRTFPATIRLCPPRALARLPAAIWHGCSPPSSARLPGAFAYIYFPSTSISLSLPPSLPVFFVFTQTKQTCLSTRNPSEPERAKELLTAESQTSIHVFSTLQLSSVH